MHLLYLRKEDVEITMRMWNVEILNDRDSTEKIAHKLVEERFVACVNYSLTKSIYRWKGNVEKESEYALLMKTRKNLYSELEKRDYEFCIPMRYQPYLPIKSIGFLKIIYPG